MHLEARFALGSRISRSASVSIHGKKPQQRSLTTTFSAMDKSDTYKFGPHTIPGSHVFALSDLSFGFVNLKPVVPGHVLVSTKRVVQRFTDLTTEEVSDLWLLAQHIGRVVEPQYGAQSLTLAIQDGAFAGQTVPHVHIHVLPRKAGDFPRNDEVYDAIDHKAIEYDKAAKAAQSTDANSGPGEKLDLDKERRARTDGEMAEEATLLRALMKRRLPSPQL
ncbi:hypothetical protein Vretimale_4153 [Volvox reticuliferus]|uniref:Bis(5'-adenosyl)-triphosphatase n=1 Tax=Volvox reticuliferus TaxID=1737510 RepID=A0A8J4G425_9CHLO|nr:hypothetical protein Vretimale_4153 [Volvox reticuliferus]